jgi:hypothetical protein
MVTQQPPSKKKPKIDEAAKIAYAIIIPLVALYFKSDIQKNLADTERQLKDDLSSFVMGKLEGNISSLPEDQINNILDDVYKQHIMPILEGPESSALLPQYKAKQIHPKNISTSQKALYYAGTLAEYFENLGKGLLSDAISQTIIANLAETTKQVASLPVSMLTIFAMNRVCDKVKSYVPLPSELLMNMYWQSVKIEPRLQVKLTQLQGLLDELPFDLRDVTSSIGQPEKHMEANLKLTKLQNRIKEFSKELQDEYIKLKKKDKAEEISTRVKDKLDATEQALVDYKNKHPKNR